MMYVTVMLQRRKMQRGSEQEFAQKIPVLYSQDGTKK
jgi:hypothetical protein